MELKEALAHAREYAVRAEGKSVSAAAAKAYIDALPRAEMEGGAEGVRVQMLYISSNLAGWKGDLARECKAVIKRAGRI